MKETTKYNEYMGIHVGVDILSISTQAYSILRARRINIAHDIEKGTITLSPTVKGKGFAVNNGTARSKLHRIMPTGRYLLSEQNGRKMTFVKET